MFCEKMVVLGDVFIIEISYSNIKNDIKKKRKIKEGEINSVILSAYLILHFAVNSQNPKWLDEQIEEKKKSEIGNEFFLHY